jgi:hypothetical protein
MLEARVASAWIRRMSINARGDTEGEGAGVATWLPAPDPAVFASAIDVATLRLNSSDFG